MNNQSKTAYRIFKKGEQARKKHLAEEHNFKISRYSQQKSVEHIEESFEKQKRRLSISARFRYRNQAGQ